MGKTFILYNSTLWAPYKEFTYTGEPEEFTLQPDTYLFVANGARGGKTTWNQFIPWGGTTYGVLDLDHSQTFYAVVGGNGEDVTQIDGVRRLGGYNGGGNGGLSCKLDQYSSGASGGGASDVRLSTTTESMIDKTIPDTYDQLEYILSDGTQYINTDYIPPATSNIECEFEVILNSDRNYEALFGARTAAFNTCFLFFTRFAGGNVPCFSSGNAETQGSDMHYNEKLKLTVVNNTVSWYDMNGNLISSITSAPRVNCTQPLFIFDLNNGGGRDGSFCRAKIYSFKIIENNVIKRWLIPVAKHDNPTICGLYDIITDTFLQKAEGNNFTAGSVVEKDVFTIPYNESLFSRIFVAGGGGGAPFEYNNDNYQYFTSFGGGPISGWVTGRGGANNKLYSHASQTYGYSFGIGANAEDRILSSSVASWGAEGQGGGGGGWYGGYAARGLRSPNTADTACGGAGGSSYILTESSYKPNGYMNNFIDIMPSLYFRDGLMLPYQAFDGPSIIIYKAATTPPLVEDTVIIPYTGEEQSMMLIPGEYRIKCYGGDGATRFRIDLASKGGYAEGVLKLQTNQPLYYHVGSSCLLVGMNTSAATHDSIYNNRMSYHATIGSYSNAALGAMSGGGSTDVSAETESALVKRKLPDGYDQVEYIKSDTTQHIKTTYTPKTTTNIEAVVDVAPNTSTAWKILFGARTGINNKHYAFYTRANSNNIPAWCTGSVETGGTTMLYNEKVKLKSNSNVLKIYDMNDTEIDSITGGACVNCDYPLYIFDYNSGGSVYGTPTEAKIYYMILTEGDKVVRYFIPYVSQSDPTDCGLYDLVTETFHRKGAGNNFTYGAVVPKEEYEIYVGNMSRYRLSRFIVAGGGGGQGSSGHNGGNGGGSEGGSYIGGGYGSNNGPGKQSSGYAFGYGEFGKNQSGGYGGSGGSGWYGGYGTTPDGSGDDDKGGSGGSGYVLTSSSYKPSGYIPDESFWLTDTVLTQGGNSVRGMTRIVVEPLQVQALYVIAYDNAGYKAYDRTNDEWYPISISGLNREVFEMYGTHDVFIKSDTGLEFPYKYYVFDLVDIGLVSMKTHVTPETLHVTFSQKTTAEILGETYDFDKDENVDVDIKYDITGIAENRAVNIDIAFDMNDVPSRSNTFYLIQFKIRKKPSSYYYPVPPEKTIDDLDLLYVGHNVTIPSRYKPSIGGFMPDGTTAITTVNCSTSCEYKRNVYIVSLINGVNLRFTRFNILDNRSYSIRDDIAISGLTTFSNKWCCGSLLVDDENMYLYSSINRDGNNNWYKTIVMVIPLDPNKPHAPYTSSNRNNNGYGQAYWYNDTKIISCTSIGFTLFDTKTKTFTNYDDSDSNGGVRNSYAVGDYSILSYWDDNAATGPRVYKRSNITRVPDGGTPLTVPSGKKNVCYADGKFYVVQSGHLYVITDKPDSIMSIDQDILAPFSTLIPKSINYSDGLIYVTFENQATVYVYNIASEQWYPITLPFNTGSLSATTLYRPAVFKGFFFVEHLKLFVTNALQISKYRLGEKSNVLLIKTNSSIEETMTYDDRFFTVDDTGINFHTGYIVKDFTEIDNINHIYESEPYQLNEYRKFIDCELIMREEE